MLHNYYNYYYQLSGGVLADRRGGHGTAGHPRVPLLVLQGADEEEGALRAEELHQDEQELARRIEVARLHAERRLQRYQLQVRSTNPYGRYETLSRPTQKGFGFAN